MRLSRKLLSVVLSGLLFSSLRAEEPPKPAVTPTAPTANPLTPEQIADLVRDLGSEDFKARLDAEKKLASAGPAAIPELEKAATSNDPEIKTRANKLLGAIRSAPVLEKMNAVFANTISLESDLEIKMFMRGVEATMTGHVKSLVDGKRFQMTMGMALQGTQMFTKSTGDGTYMWNEMSMIPPGGAGPAVPRMVQKIPLSMVEKVSGSQQTNPIQSIKDMQEKYYFTGFKEGRLGDVECFILEGAMKADELEKRVRAIEELQGAEAAKSARIQFTQMSRTRLYVTKKDYLTCRSELIDEQGNLMLSMDLKNMQLGNKFEDTTFQYTPPPGVQLMDLEKLMKESQQMKKVKQSMEEDPNAKNPEAPKNPVDTLGPPPSLKRPPEPQK